MVWCVFDWQFCCQFQAHPFHCAKFNFNFASINYHQMINAFLCVIFIWKIAHFIVFSLSRTETILVAICALIWLWCYWSFSQLADVLADWYAFSRNLELNKRLCIICYFSCVIMIPLHNFDEVHLWNSLVILLFSLFSNYAIILPQTNL